MAGIPVTVRATALVSPEWAFDVIAPIDLSSIFTGFGPLPAVTGVREQSGEWDHTGATRVVELAGGDEAPERITAFDRPGHFGYVVGPFSGPLGRLVERAEGGWWFEAEGPATRIVWTYTFVPRPGFSVVVRWVAAPLWRAYARRVLDGAAAAAEGAAPTR